MAGEGVHSPLNPWIADTSAHLSVLLKFADTFRSALFVYFIGGFAYFSGRLLKLNYDFKAPARKLSQASSSIKISTDGWSTNIGKLVCQLP